MNAPTPILDAETILVTAVRNALAPFVGTHQGRPKAYYQLGKQNAPLPFVVFQFQTDISALNRLGAIGASAQITVKAFAESKEAARALLAHVAPGMNALAHPSHTITARYLRSPIIPSSVAPYQSAHIWRVSIERM